MPTDLPTKPPADDADLAAIEQAVAKAIHDHWKLYLVEGVLLVLLGLIAILIPQLATLTVTILLGWLFLISGIIGLITTFWMRNAPGFWWALASGALAILAGAWALSQPLLGALSLTVVLAVFFIIEGIASIFFSLDHRRELSGQWGWMLASGVVDLVLAAMIIMGLPSTAVWALGLLVGINMLFGGTALIAMALHARRETL